MFKLLTALAATALFVIGGGPVWKAEAAPMSILGSLARHATGYEPTEVGYYRRYARRAYRRGYYGYGYPGYGYYRPYGYYGGYQPYGYYGYGWRPGIYVGRGWGWRY
jgi:hypothetical protein